MSKKVKKINQLKKLQGFVQLNFFKGFKYIDKAGEFFNHFCKDNNIPNYLMDGAGMTVKIDEKIQLKTSPHHLWMHFLEPETFDIQKRKFFEKAELVNSLFEPERYTRIGWRNYMVFECGEEYPNILPNDYLPNSEFNEIVFTKNIQKFSLRVSVSKLIKENVNTKAILFDIDIFKKCDFSRNDFAKINSLLNEIEKVYKSGELLTVINDLVK